MSKYLRVKGGEAAGVEGVSKPPILAFSRLQSGSCIVYKIEGGWERLRMRDVGRITDDLSFNC